MAAKVRRWFGISDGIKGIIVLVFAMVGMFIILARRGNISVPFLTPLAEKVAGA